MWENGKARKKILKKWKCVAHISQWKVEEKKKEGNIQEQWNLKSVFFICPLLFLFILF